jgi:cell wall-associated NlpC family hydrolase
MSAGQYLPLVARAAQKYGVSPSLLAAQLQQESGFNPNAKSPAGALGIAQFMPGTAKGFGIDPMNPAQAIDAQAKYMHNLLSKYKGNTKLALAAYNAGSGNVDKYHGIPPFAETQRYVKAILSGESQFPKLQGGGAPPAATQTATSKAPTQSLQTPTLTPGSDPTQARQSLLAYLMTNGATQASGQAGGDPNAGLVSLLTSMPTQSVPQLKVKASTPQAAAKANTNPNVSGIVNIAKKYLGTPYSWGGGTTKGPSKGFAQGANTVGFDCSSFVQFVTHQATGKTIPRTTYQQFKAGTPVAKGKLQPGDAVYFEPGAQGPGHVGMYIGGGQFIESPHTGATIRISNLNQRSDFVGARRFT